MKTALSKLAFAAAFGLAFTTAFADAIYFTSGQEIENASVIEIGTDDIKYKVSGKEVVYTAKKSDIAIIFYANGTRDVFPCSLCSGAASASAPAYAPPPPPPPQQLQPQPPQQQPSQELPQQPSPQQEQQPQRQASEPAQGRLGAQVLLGLNSFSSGDAEGDKYIDMGYSIGAGAIKIFPFSELLAFSVEANLYYRKLYSYSYDIYSSSITEFALSIPAAVQVSPAQFIPAMANMPLYLSAGLQIDIPFVSEWDTGSDTGEIENRAAFDIGFVLGVGYHITKDLAIDFKAVIGIGSLTSESRDESSLNQYNFGAIKFF